MRTPRATPGQSRSGFRRVDPSGRMSGHAASRRARQAVCSGDADRPGKPAGRESTAANSTMARMPLAVVSSDEFANHLTPPGHPERPERAHVFDAVATAWRGQGGTVLAPRPATLEELGAVHDRDHIERIAGTAGRAAMLDPDTFTSPESYDLARLAAGAALVGVDHAMAGDGPALVLVRPPGHHAERERAMGFCLFNNVAVAAAYARAKGASRVAVVDIDVHHGNGTQQIFEDDQSVLYVSTHQYPCYPGTGAVTEVGFGTGRGRTVNVPIEPGAGDDDYADVLARVVVPILTAFAADAHHPVGRLRRARPGSAGADAGHDRRLPRDAGDAARHRRRHVGRTPRGRHRGRLRPAGAGRVPGRDGRGAGRPGRRSPAGPARRATRRAPAARASAAARPPRPRWPSSGRSGRYRYNRQLPRRTRSPTPDPTDPWPITRPNPSSRNGRRAGPLPAPSRSRSIGRGRSSTASRCSRIPRDTPTSATSATT